MVMRAYKYTFWGGVEMINLNWFDLQILSYYRIPQ